MENQKSVLDIELELEKNGWERERDPITWEKMGKFVNREIVQILEYLPADNELDIILFGNESNLNMLRELYNKKFEQFAQKEGFTIPEGPTGSYLLMTQVNRDDVIHTVDKMTQGYKNIAEEIYRKEVEQNPKIAEIYKGSFKSINEMLV